MKMRFFKCTLVIVCLLLNLSVKAYDFESGGIYYEITSENYLEVSVTSSDDSKYMGDIIIPETVEYNSKTYSVINIGPKAFYESSDLTSITLPNSVTSIKEDTFRGCTGLTSIILPNSVTNVENNAFWGCQSLTSVTLPNGLKRIGQGVFGVCRSLASIILPNSVVSIGRNAFYGCQSLTSVTLPNNITSLEAGIFSECTGLTSITIPNNVTSIEQIAFANCINLTSIILSDNVTNIEQGVFQNCRKITSITLPSSIKNIESRVFSGCIKLESITLPSTVTEIQERAFEDCSLLRTINFPDNLKSIGDNSFRNCTSLESIDLPVGLQSIGSEAFYYCKRLQKIIVHKSLPLSIDKNTFEGVDYQNCKLYAPLNSKENYSKATGWMNFTNIIEDVAFGKHLLTVTANQGGKVAILDEEVRNTTVNWSIQSNEQVKFTVVPDDKYQIYKVLLNQKDITNKLSGNSYTIENLAEDVTLEVTFVEKTYTITASANEGQGIILINGEYTATKIFKEGETVQFTIIPQKEYCIERVLLGEKDVTIQLRDGVYTLSEVMEDTSLAVTFKQIEVETVSFAIRSSEGGSLKQEIPVGSSTAYQILPTENWKINTITFNGVDVTSELVDNLYTTPAVTENSILSVVFINSGEGIGTSTVNQIKVYASQKNIIVKGTAVDTPIQIYSTSGQMIHSSRSVEDVTTITLAESGVYLIKIENNTYKVNL